MSHHSQGTSGYVGLLPAKRQRQEIFVLKRQFQNLRVECADRVAGQGVCIENKKARHKTDSFRIAPFSGSIFSFT